MATMEGPESKGQPLGAAAVVWAFFFFWRLDFGLVRTSSQRCRRLWSHACCPCCEPTSRKVCRGCRRRVALQSLGPGGFARFGGSGPSGAKWWILASQRRPTRSNPKHDLSGTARTDCLQVPARSHNWGISWGAAGQTWQSQTGRVWGKRSLSALKEPQHRSKGTTSFAHLGDPGPGSTLNRFYILVRSKAESLKTRSETGWVQTRTHRNGYNSCEGQPVSPARWKRHTEGRSDGAANDASVQHWRRDRGIDPEPPSESKGRRGFSPVWSPASRAGF